MDSDKKSLFEEAMKNVKPLRASNKVHIKKEKTPITTPRKSTPLNTPKPHHIALSNPWDISDIHANTSLSFGKVHIQAKQFRALRHGEIRPEASLDLHGFYLNKAGDELLQFIQHAYTQNMRCVLVIHGKGGRFHEPPVIKAHVHHWLKQLPEVLAFHSAKARDGGYGAVYVLLRR
ncbi:MAG: Smr/MutS family protein [Legionellaceae bacterium]|nr:Smr/MutS family protein [Legionellaceae bacterium]